MKLQLFLVCALSGATASAMFRHPDIQEVPAARLIKNVSAYVAKHPHDPEGPYMLGRLNYLAFSQSTDLFHEAVETKLGDADHLIELSRTFGASDPLHGDLPQKKRLEFLKSAIRNLRKAVEMKAGEGLYWLTLGSALRDGAPFANQEPDEFASPPGKWDPAVLQSLTPTVVPLNPRASKAETADHLAKQRSAQWTEEAIFAFATAYTRSKPPPGTVQTMTFGRAPVDVEAGEAYVDLVKKRGVKPAESPASRRSRRTWRASRSAGDP